MIFLVDEDKVFREAEKNMSASVSWRVVVRLCLLRYYSEFVDLCSGCVFRITRLHYSFSCF